ncbi:hypothetical protein [Fervidicella metallireducens]|uniref:hypothetical protein n=1 Tax=Fervidicella metallireducens TaxID=655338 RepID=UPI000555E218|nr:hypothetical protein [Fervidicella metallireducens]
MKNIVQIMLLWNENDPEDKKLVDRLMKGFNKMGSWNVQLPPKGSIYKQLIVYEGEDLKEKRGE